MLIALHKNATTTPAIRAAIQKSTGSDYELARQFGVCRDTIRKWRKRDTVQDGSHTAHRLQTTLNAGPEELVIYLRIQLLLPLDDLLAVIREFIEPGMSCSALDRLLRRRGHSRLPAPDKPAVAARSFLNSVHKAAPFKVRTLLTDNGKEFTDRLFGSRAKQASGLYEFDTLCQSLGIEHRLTRPKSPQTNGMVERVNGRLEQVLRSHHFNSADDLETTLHRFVWLYNQHLPQKALNHEAPVQALKRWKTTHPHLFSKQVRNHPGPDM